ncbi:MAG: hypothetical protein ABEJ22_01140 [Haloferacaceae archaeon]
MFRYDGAVVVSVAMLAGRPGIDRVGDFVVETEVSLVERALKRLSPPL